MTTSLNTMPVRIGLLGCGRHVMNSMLPNLIGHSDTRIIAACDVQESRRTALLERLPHVQMFTSAAELLAHSSQLGIDAVLIALDPENHVRYAREAINRGLHVYVEKPAAFHSRELTQVAEAAKTARLTTCVGTKWRYTPGSAVATGWVREKGLNPLLLVLDATYPKSLNPHLWGLNPTQLVFYEEFIHAFDYLGVWMAEPETVQVRLVENGPHPSAAVQVVDRDGVVALMSLVKASAAYQVNLTAHLNDGTQLRLRNMTHLEIIEPHSWAGTEGSLRDHPSLNWDPGRLYRSYARAGYAEMWDAFIKAVQNKADTASNLHAHARALAIAERCLAQLGQALPDEGGEHAE